MPSSLSLSRPRPTSLALPRRSRSVSFAPARALFGRNKRQQQEAAAEAPAPRRNKNSARRRQQLLVSPEAPPSSLSFSERYASAPPLVRAVIGVAVAAAVVSVLKRIRGGRDSMSALESRGFVGDYSDRASPRLNSEDSYRRAMRGVNVVAYEELSEEAIAAARSRRMREREASPPDLEALATDLPDDHPFAVRAEVSPEEAELAAARLRVKRGLPLKDLSGARGFASDEERR